MPCWWMPASWAKALAPTIDLLRGGDTLVTCASARLAAMIRVVSMPVETP